jgi:hypothetical protein
MFSLKGGRETVFGGIGEPELRNGCPLCKLAATTSAKSRLAHALGAIGHI